MIVNKESKNFALVTDSRIAFDISTRYKMNVLICYKTHNLKHVFFFAPKDINVRPVITENDDDYLTYETNYLTFIDEKLKKEMRRDD